MESIDSINELILGWFPLSNSFLYSCTRTLGAREFSSAVSGFCQVFIVTRIFLTASPLVASAFGQHRKFPPHARKTSGTQSIALVMRTEFTSQSRIYVFFSSQFSALRFAEETLRDPSGHSLQARSIRNMGRDC